MYGSCIIVRTVGTNQYIDGYITNLAELGFQLRIETARIQSILIIQLQSYQQSSITFGGSTRKTRCKEESKQRLIKNQSVWC